MLIGEKNVRKRGIPVIALDDFAGLFLCKLNFVGGFLRLLLLFLQYDGGERGRSLIRKKAAFNIGRPLIFFFPFKSYFPDIQEFAHVRL
jgi:hypothetical protein